MAKTSNTFNINELIALSNLPRHTIEDLKRTKVIKPLQVGTLIYDYNTLLILRMIYECKAEGFKPAEIRNLFTNIPDVVLKNYDILMTDKETWLELKVISEDTKLDLFMSDYDSNLISRVKNTSSFTWEQFLKDGKLSYFVLHDNMKPLEVLEKYRLEEITNIGTLTYNEGLAIIYMYRIIADLELEAQKLNIQLDNKINHPNYLKGHAIAV